MDIGQHDLVKTLHIDPVSGQGTGRAHQGGQGCQHNELLFYDHSTHLHLCVSGEWRKLKWRGGKGHGYFIQISLILILYIALQVHCLYFLFLLENKALILNGLFLNVDVTIFHHHGDMKDGWIYKTEHF
ncbi:hypothetical protein PUB92_21525 [Aeromonas dhakensis]|nr:hypothetical protein [Aeromonas dhakensis]WDF94715.1 hypothetical protein PUB92_21525 [Aeromonas dhakensis]